MNNKSLFSNYWSRYSSCSISERRQYFDSLTHSEQESLLRSFYSEEWPDLFYQNMLEETLLNIELNYYINLIDLRIKAIKLGKVFLVPCVIWDKIEQLVGVYEDYVDLTFVFGGLKIMAWGKNKEFYRIRAFKNRWR